MTPSEPTPWWDLCLQHRDFVVRLAKSLVHDAGSADDLAQDALLIAVAKPPPRQLSPRAWLSTVVRRLAKDRARSEARRRWREQEVASEESQLQAVGRFHDQMQLQRVLLESLEHLPEAYGTVLFLHFYEELPYREIATHLGVPVETVRTRARRGLAKLRERLDKSYGGDRGAWSLVLIGWIGRTTPGPSPKVAASSGGLILPVLGTALALAGFAIWFSLERGGSPGHRGTQVASNLTEPKPAAPDRSAQPMAKGSIQAPERQPTVGPASPPMFSVTGRAVQPDGTPAEGALVWISDGPGVAGSLSTVCDDQGMFELEAVHRAHWISAYDERFGFSESLALMSWSARGLQRAEVDLWLPEPGRLVTGTVRDSRGRVLEHARLRGIVPPHVHRYGLRGHLLQQGPPTEATSDEEGRFAFLSHERRWQVSCAGYAPQVIEAGEEPEADLEIVLTEETMAGSPAERSEPIEIVGRLLDEEGAPLAGWWIEAVPESEMVPGLDPFRCERPRRTTTCDAEGRFVLTGCDPVEHTVLVRRSPEGMPLRWRPGIVPGLGTLEMRMSRSICPSPGLRGTIDVHDPSLLDGALVMAYSKILGRTEFTCVDPSTGSFELGPLPPGRYTPEVWLEGRAPVRLERTAVFSDRFANIGTVWIDGFGTIELALNAAQEQLEEVEVFLKSRTGPFGLGMNSTRREQGRIRIRNVPPDRYSLIVRARGWAREQTDVEVRAGDRVLRNLELVRGREVRFTFEDPLPPASRRGFHLTLFDSFGNEHAWTVLAWKGSEPLEFALTLRPGDYSYVARTVDRKRAEGSFSIPGVEGPPIAVGGSVE